MIKRIEDNNSIKETITYKEGDEVKEIGFLKQFDQQNMELTGPLSGKGMTMGPPHNRTGWNAELSYPKGFPKQGKIQLTDTVVGKNVISATNYLDESGKLVALSKVLYVQVEKETYETLIQALRSSVK